MNRAEDTIKLKLEEIARSVGGNLMREDFQDNVNLLMPENNDYGLIRTRARTVYRAIQQAIEKGILEGDSTTPRILWLQTERNESHFVIDYKGFIVDPAIRQLSPDNKKSVWAPEEMYPIRLRKHPVDLTDISVPKFYHDSKRPLTNPSH